MRSFSKRGFLPVFDSCQPFRAAQSSASVASQTAAGGQRNQPQPCSSRRW